MGKLIEEYDFCPVCGGEWRAGCHEESCTGRMCSQRHHWYIDKYHKVVQKECGHKLPPPEQRSPYGMCA